MNIRIIAILASKDFYLFFRNRFIAVITVLGIVAYLVIYFVMPRSVDETLEIGLYAPVIPPAFEQMQQEEGLKIETVESEETLKKAVADGEYVAGVALPAEIMDGSTSGQKPKVIVYFTSDTPPEVKEPVEVLIRELFYQQTGQPLALELSMEVLGRDMVGMQIPLRDRMLPLFAVLLVVMETFGLASLSSMASRVGRKTGSRPIQKA